MSLLDAILQSQGGGAVQQLGSQFGLNDSQTTAALSALVPALAAGLSKQTQSPAGLDGLIGALTSGGHSRYVDNPSSLTQPSTINDGNGILGHVFGSKDVSRQVAAHAASQTGIGEDVLKKMLPMVAALVMGALARQATGGAGGGSALSKIGGSALSGFGSTAITSILKATLNQGGGGAGGGLLGGLLGSLFKH